MKELLKLTNIYYCMDCDYSWESEYDDETVCRKCGCGDLHVEEIEDGENSNETRKSN